MCVCVYIYIYMCVCVCVCVYVCMRVQFRGVIFFNEYYSRHNRTISLIGNNKIVLRQLSMYTFAQSLSTVKDVRREKVNFQVE